MVIQPKQRWFIRHAAQRTDIYRGAQNVADETGIEQHIFQTKALWDADAAKGRELVVIEGEAFLLLDTVKQNPIRAAAGR